MSLRSLRPVANRRLRFVVVAIGGLWLIGAASPESGMAQSPVGKTPPTTAPPRGKPSLDDDLLRDLPPTKPQPAPGNVGPPDPTNPAEKPIDKPTVEKTDASGRSSPNVARPPAPPAGLDPRSSEEGEDIDLNTPAARLRRIQERMSAARDRLAQRDTSTVTLQLQDQVLTDLDAFLEQLQKSSSSSPSAAGSSAAGKQTAANTPGQRQSRPRPKDSSLEGGVTEQGGAGDQEERAAVKEVWGQWPARLREQVQNAMPEKFLPAYESLIEAYYRRLAEEPLR